MSVTAAAKDIMKESKNKKEVGKSHSWYSQLIGIEELKGNICVYGIAGQAVKYEKATKKIAKNCM